MLEEPGAVEYVRDHLARTGRRDAIPMLEAALTYYEERKAMIAVMEREMRRLIREANLAGVPVRDLAPAIGRPRSWVVEQLRLAKLDAEEGTTK